MSGSTTPIKIALAIGVSMTCLVASEAAAQGTGDSSSAAQNAAPIETPGAPAATPQQPSSPTPADAVDKSAEGGLQDIVVTAQKRVENIQDVPIAITAISGEAVSNLHANSLQGLYGAVPSVQLNNYVNTPAVAAFYIRGMGILEADPYAGTTVSIVVDQVPQYFSMGALLDTYDLERVEILRGPQGTLFGANTTGGVVNVTTRQPTGEFGGKVEATYGAWHRFDFLAAVDFPLIPDVLAGKLVYNHTQRDGWVTNVVDGSSMGDRNHNDFRGYLKLTPGGAFDATLSGEYVRGRDGSPVQINGGVPGEALFRPAGTVYPNSKLPMYQSPCFTLLVPCKAPNKYYGANNSVRDYSNLDTYSGTLIMNLRDTPIGDITSVTGYKHIHLKEETDQDGTPEFLLDTQRTSTLWQFSQELRSAADITDWFNVIYGVFYLKTDFRHLQSSLLAFAIPGVRQDNPQHQSNYSVSGFAQGYANVTDKLRLQAGIRYTYEHTAMHTGTQRYAVGPGPGQWPDVIAGTFIDDAGSFLVSGSKTWKNVGWKLGADYHIDDDRLLYAYWARGFKSGGFVGRLGIPQDIGPYDPEKVDTYEVGVKADWLDRRLRTNLTAFYTNYRDMQLSQQYITSVPGNDYVQGNTILNVASAHIKGIEFDGSAVPFKGLTLTASATYLDAKYKKFPFLAIDGLHPQGFFIDLAGYRLQNSPKWASSIGFNYQFGIGPGRASAGMTYNYTAQKFLTSQTDAPRSVIQPTHLVNANLDWTPDNGNWSIGVWGTNIFDNRYLANVYDFPGLFSFVSYAAPREYGATAKFHW
jgi:iron complex outermembrane receptor protein